MTAAADDFEFPKAEAPLGSVVGVLYEQHFDFVWRSIRRLGVQESLVDDATHDVFVIVHRSLSQFEKRSSLKTWIFGIAQRVAQQYRQKGASAAAPEPQLPELADAAAGPDGIHEHRERLSLLYELLDTLSDEKRAVFILAELEEMTAPEIGQALGIKLNTVYSRLRTARVEFDQALARKNSALKKGAP